MRGAGGESREERVCVCVPVCVCVRVCERGRGWCVCERGGEEQMCVRECSSQLHTSHAQTYIEE